MDGPAALSTALRRGTFEFCVLALMEDGEQYGVELVRRLGAERTLTTSEGTLYPLLGPAAARRPGGRRSGGSRRPDRRGATTH